MKITTVDDVRDYLRATLGHEPEYFGLTSQNVISLDPEPELSDVLLAIHLELSRSIATVMERLPGISASTVLAACRNAKFDVDRMICDQYRGGTKLRALSILHRLGHERLRSILRAGGVTVGDRKTRTDVSDQQLLEAWIEVGKNCCAVARRFHMHRGTASKRIARLVGQQRMSSSERPSGS